MILTLGGVGIAAAGCISSLIWEGNFNVESGSGFVVLVPAGISLAVGVPATIVGIPLWAIGSQRINKASLAFKTFNIVQENSLALGLGVTIRF